MARVSGIASDIVNHGGLRPEDQRFESLLRARLSCSSIQYEYGGLPVSVRRVALRPNGSRLSRKAEEGHHRSLDLDDLLRCQPTDSGVDVRPFDGGELVDHYVTIVVESR